MCYEAQRNHEGDGGAGPETRGSLVWEANTATEVIRYLDVMLNMLPLAF